MCELVVFIWNTIVYCLAIDKRAAHLLFNVYMQYLKVLR